MHEAREIPSRTIAIVLARSRSKRLKDKNIQILGTKPLLQWAVEAARDSQVVGKVFVSTDSDEYAQIAQRAGAEVIRRPPQLATDDATSEDTVGHALDIILDGIEGYEIGVLLQPTSPLTKAETIRNTVEAVAVKGYDTALSVVKAKHRPFWAFSMDESGSLKPFITLPHDSPYAGERPPDLFYPTGGVYAFKIDFFRESHRVYGGFMFGVQVGQLEAIDIDDEVDLNFARYALMMLESGIRNMP